MLSQEILKWLVSFVISALTAIAVTCKKQIAEFFKFKKKKVKDDILSDVNEGMTSIEDHIEQHEENNALEFKKHDQLYSKKLVELEERLMIMLSPMREALLSSHYQNLLEKCKRYVQAGEISADELDNIEKDYETYKALGGNGHMEMWMVRVRQLKVI